MTTLAQSKPSEPKPSETSGGSKRLMSVDALRGFDMFWIIGADSLVYALHHLSNNKITTFFADELEHADWKGFHFYDLIFPMFVFIMGVSLVFSLNKAVAQAGRAGALARVFRRSILLFIVALFYSGGFSHRGRTFACSACSTGSRSPIFSPACASFI